MVIPTIQGSSFRLHFINSTFQIYSLFVPEMSTSLMLYTVQIIYITFIWIL